jgi:hypothetical protein
MASSSIEFRSVAPGRVSDHIRLFLIHKELRAMAKRQEALHEMDYDPYLINCIEKCIDAIDAYENYDPTPQYLYGDDGGEPPLTAEEMHAGAWKEHQELHS